VKIVMTGFRGSGKSAIGRRLARLLGLPYIDTDEEISRITGQAITEIFARQGEARFRDLERAVIRPLAGFQGVISTGGGAVLDPANVEHLRRESTTILLTASPATIEARIRNARRPALTTLPLHEEIVTLLAQRQEAYLSSADLCFSTDGTSPDDAAQEILRMLSVRSVPAEATALATPMIDRMEDAGERDILEHLVRNGESPDVRVLGIAGYPCRHSRSPPLYNALFRKYGMQMRYTRFDWAEIADIIRLARLTGMRGLSVTIPFKEQVRSCLDEEDPATQAIGACNTVIFCGGKAYGRNTDWIGVKNAVEHLKRARAVLLGTGGAAAAAAYAMQALGMDVTVYGRDAQKARAFAERFGIRHGSLGSVDTRNTDLIVHATPVGMDGDSRSLLSADQIPEGCTVFDLVYTPPVTPLLREAQKRGASVIPGTEMFIHQACAQFRLFTGISVQEATVREMLQ
jgi:shikimate dehydrogenase